MTFTGSLFHHERIDDCFPLPLLYLCRGRAHPPRLNRGRCNSRAPRPLLLCRGSEREGCAVRRLLLTPDYLASNYSVLRSTVGGAPCSIALAMPHGGFLSSLALPRVPRPCFASSIHRACNCGRGRALALAVGGGKGFHARSPMRVLDDCRAVCFFPKAEPQDPETLSAKAARSRWEEVGD